MYLFIKRQPFFVQSLIERSFTALVLDKLSQPVLKSRQNVIDRMSYLSTAESFGGMEGILFSFGN